MSTEDDLCAAIAEFVSTTLGIRMERIRPATRLLQDCGVDGDDATDFMVAFSKRFSVDLSDFVFDRHFGPEAGFDPLRWIAGKLAGKPNTLIDIRVQDLVAAARTGKWTY